MDLSVFFAGTSGSIPTVRRGLPALLLRRGGDRILFDCGEGTQRQLVRSVGLTDLDEVFLTHFHADHWLGLPGLLKTFDLRARERSLAIHGPPGLQQLIALALRAAGRVHYELDLVELEPGDVLERDGYRIAPVPVSHRGRAFGYVVYEDTRRASAGRRLEKTLKALREAGVATQGFVVETGPIQAAKDALAQLQPKIDEIVVATHGVERSGWMRRDVVGEIERIADVPVKHVVVTPAEDGETNVLVIANQTVVSGSACTSGSALFRNASTSASFPGFASSLTNSATVTIGAVSLIGPARVRSIVMLRRGKARRHLVRTRRCAATSPGCVAHSDRWPDRGLSPTSRAI